MVADSGRTADAGKGQNPNPKIASSTRTISSGAGTDRPCVVEIAEMDENGLLVGGTSYYVLDMGNFVQTNASNPMEAVGALDEYLIRWEAPLERKTAASFAKAVRDFFIRMSRGDARQFNVSVIDEAARLPSGTVETISVDQSGGLIVAVSHIPADPAPDGIQEHGDSENKSPASENNTKAAGSRRRNSPGPRSGG